MNEYELTPGAAQRAAETNMDFTVRTISPPQSRPVADKRALQTIGLLFAVATLIVIGAAGLAVRHELGSSAERVESAGLSQLSAVNT